MSAQHTPTPLPWTFDGLVVKAANGTVVAQVNPLCNLAAVVPGQATQMEERAMVAYYNNGHLLAAAPRMFNELRAASTSLCDLAVNNSHIETELHAIAEKLYNATL